VSGRAARAEKKVLRYCVQRKTTPSLLSTPPMARKTSMRTFLCGIAERTFAQRAASKRRLRHLPLSTRHAVTFERLASTYSGIVVVTPPIS
jgi:hypothetical protein